MKKILRIAFLAISCIVFAEYPYPETQACPQDGATSNIVGLCTHGTAATICTYSHLTGEIDAKGQAVKHTFKIKFDN